MIKTWMIYGANGFTGELIAREAVKRGEKPVLAGRNKNAIPALAHELGLSFKVFSLEMTSNAIQALATVDLVLHCAGPFSETSDPMVQACLATKTHYLDITGEIEVFEKLRFQNVQAKQRQIMLMPGVGFDVVPTDCLAVNLKKYLPDATSLTLALDSQGGPSRGTALTMIEGLKVGGKIRESGRIKNVPLGYKTKKVHFAHKTRKTATIPWGDVSTAFYSTGIPNIEVYSSLKPSLIWLLRLLRPFRWLLGNTVMQNFLKRRIRRKHINPTPVDRKKTRSYVWGQVKNSRNQTRQAHLILPNGYDLTTQAAISVVQYFKKTNIQIGFQTPATVLGEHFVRSLPGVEMKIDY